MKKTKKISLSARHRKKQEKSRSLRRKELLPAIIYGPKTKPTLVVLKQKEAEHIFQEAGTSHLIDLEIAGKKVKVLIYDAQFDPISGKLIHLDFYAVRMDKPIKVEIPLEYVGVSPAVKNSGGVLLAEKDSVEVECLPQDLIDEIKVDISPLKTFDDVIKISDLKIPQTIKVLEDKDIVLATVQPPRSEEELALLEEAPVEDIEAVEIEEKGKEEEEGEEKEPEAEKTEGTELTKKTPTGENKT